MRTMLSAFKPLFLMLLAGYLLFLGVSFFTSDNKPVITINPSQIKTSNKKIKPLSWQEKAEQVQMAINKQVVFNEAINMGLLETKTAQQRIKRITKLTENPHYNAQQKIIYSDPLLKNYLTITLENIIKDRFPLKNIDDVKANTWIKNNPQEKKIRLTLSHVFIDGFTKEAKSKALAAFKKITHNNLSVEKAILLGDVFYGPQTFTAISIDELSQYLGSKALKKTVTEKKWLNPILSAYGWHIFHIDKVIYSTTSNNDSYEKTRALLKQQQIQKKWHAWLEIKRKKYSYQIILPEQWGNKIIINSEGVVQCKNC